MVSLCRVSFVFKVAHKHAENLLRLLQVENQRLDFSVSFIINLLQIETMLSETVFTFLLPLFFMQNY